MTQAEHARLHSTKNRKCEQPGCEKKHYAKGFCSVHYQRDYYKRGYRPPSRIELAPPRDCETCGESFQPVRENHNQRFCTNRCSIAYARSLRR